MPEERKVYRSPARAAAKARPAKTAAPRPPQPPKKPKRRSAKRRRSMLVLGLCLLCLVVVLVVSVVLVRCTAEPEGPAAPDFGTPADAWQKNELGYYFNTSGQAMPAAVLKGMDVSKFQGEVDWEKAKAAGIDFAIIRCGYGGEWDGQEENWAQDDTYWRRNADECTRLGIPFGTYLYSYATTVEEARSEADHVARLLGLTAPPQEGLDDYTAAPYQLSYPVYYDLEDKYISGVFPAEMAELTEAFFSRLEEHGYTGKQGLYASLNWVRGRFRIPASTNGATISGSPALPTSWATTAPTICGNRRTAPPARTTVCRARRWIWISSCGRLHLQACRPATARRQRRCC